MSSPIYVGSFRNGATECQVSTSWDDDFFEGHILLDGQEIGSVVATTLEELQFNFQEALNDEKVGLQIDDGMQVGNAGRNSNDGFDLIEPTAPKHPGTFVTYFEHDGLRCEVRLIEVVNAYVGHISRDGWPWGKVTADSLRELGAKFLTWNL